MYRWMRSAEGLVWLWSEFYKLIAVCLGLAFVLEVGIEFFLCFDLPLRLQEFDVIAIEVDGVAISGSLLPSSILRGTESVCHWVNSSLMFVSVS